MNKLIIVVFLIIVIGILSGTIKKETSYELVDHQITVERTLRDFNGNVITEESLSNDSSLSDEQTRMIVKSFDYICANKTEEAIQIFKKPLEKNPTDPFLLNALGTLYINYTEDEEIGWQYLEQAYELYPDSIENQYFHVLYCASHNQLEEAERIDRQVITAMPSLKEEEDLYVAVEIVYEWLEHFYPENPDVSWIQDAIKQTDYMNNVHLFACLLHTYNLDIIQKEQNADPTLDETIDEYLQVHDSLSIPKDKMSNEFQFFELFDDYNACNDIVDKELDKRD